MGMYEIWLKLHVDIPFFSFLFSFLFFFFFFFWRYCHCTCYNDKDGYIYIKEQTTGVFWHRVLWLNFVVELRKKKTNKLWSVGWCWLTQLGCWFGERVASKRWVLIEYGPGDINLMECQSFGWICGFLVLLV